MGNRGTRKLCALSVRRQITVDLLVMGWVVETAIDNPTLLCYYIGIRYIVVRYTVQRYITKAKIYDWYKAT
jgi:hypothetical protein